MRRYTYLHTHTRVFVFAIAITGHRRNINKLLTFIETNDGINSFARVFRMHGCIGVRLRLWVIGDAYIYEKNLEHIHCAEALYVHEFIFVVGD